MPKVVFVVIHNLFALLACCLWMGKILDSSIGLKITPRYDGLALQLPTVRWGGENQCGTKHSSDKWLPCVMLRMLVYYGQ